MTTGIPAEPADDWWSELAHEPGHASNRPQQRRSLDSASTTIDSGQHLDITNNSFDPQRYRLLHPDHDPGHLASGYNGGHWNGTGIISSPPRRGSERMAVMPVETSCISGLSSGQIKSPTPYMAILILTEPSTPRFQRLGVQLRQKVFPAAGRWGFCLRRRRQQRRLRPLRRKSRERGPAAERRSVCGGDWAALDAFAAANGISLSSVPEPASVGIVGLGLGPLPAADDALIRKQRPLPSWQPNALPNLVFGRIHRLFPYRNHIGFTRIECA